MVSIIYKILYYLIHGSVTSVELILSTVVYLKLIFCNLWYKFAATNDIEFEKRLIENTTSVITKLPAHLVIILNGEQINPANLSNIIIWSIFAGINCISFYDYTGNLIRNNEVLTQLMKLRAKNDNIILKEDNHQNRAFVYHQNGKQHKTAINFINPESSKTHWSDIAKQLGQNNAADDINIKFLDSKINEKYKFICDPDFALYFGKICCTYGLLPWQTRLTEFYQINSQDEISLDKFINALYTYSKCEQRLGK